MGRTEEWMDGPWTVGRSGMGFSGCAPLAWHGMHPGHVREASVLTREDYGIRRWGRTGRGETQMFAR